MRRAKVKDEHFVLDLVDELTAFGPPPWRDADTMTRTDRQFLRRAIRSKSQDPMALIAESDGMPAGFLHLHSVVDHHRQIRQGHISEIVVDSVYQGRGIGAFMLRSAEAWARDLGFDWLSVSVFDANRHAAALYEREGFGRDVLRLIKVL